MRRTDFQMNTDDAWAMLRRALTFHLASSTAVGAPLLRTLHGVVLDDTLYFHGAKKGEKTGVDGQRCVVQVEDAVATVPSTFFDAHRACPATTYYQSVQGAGTAFNVVDVDVKARVLQALMEKLQPEGGHVPITAHDPLYRAAVNGIAITGITFDSVAGKAKLGQNKSAAQVGHILESLWARGARGDTRAIELVRRANPAHEVPAFLRVDVDAELTLHVDMVHARSECAATDGGATFAQQAGALLEHEYWNTGVSVDDLARAHIASAAWVGVVTTAGALIASARAVSDEGKRAFIFDVIVDKRWRGRGLGKRLMTSVLAHPAMRSVGRVHLGTRDAQGLYQQFGFVDDATMPRPHPTTTMTRMQTR